MQEAWVYFHNGPVRCRKRGYIPTMDQSDAGSVGHHHPRRAFKQHAHAFTMRHRSGRGIFGGYAGVTGRGEDYSA
eukprot:9492209-Pyramimonas_sp.AAC.1